MERSIGIVAAAALWSVGGLVSHASANAVAEACASYGLGDPCTTGAYQSQTGSNSASAEVVDKAAFASATAQKNGSLSLEGSAPSDIGQPTGAIYAQVDIGDTLQFSRYYKGVLVPISDSDPVKMVITDPGLLFQVPEGDSGLYALDVGTPGSGFYHGFTEVQYGYSALPEIQTTPGDNYNTSGNVFTINLTDPSVLATGVRLSIAANLTAGGSPVASISDPPSFEFLDSAGNVIPGLVITSSSGFTWAVGSPTTSGVPETSTWALMIVGVGLAGAELRRRHARPAGPPLT